MQFAILVAVTGMLTLYVRALALFATRVIPTEKTVVAAVSAARIDVSLNFIFMISSEEIIDGKRVEGKHRG